MALLGACGGSGPSAPSAATTAGTVPAGTALSVVYGDTGAPAAGARVAVGGTTYTADASGSVRLADPVATGTPVDVTAANALDRQTALRSATATRFTLWPHTTPSGIDDNYTAALVYTDASRDDAPVGANPLFRPVASATGAVVVPSSDLLADPGAHAAHVEAIARLNAALAGHFTYTLATERPASGIVIDTRIDPADPACATGGFRGYSRLTLANNEITGGTIVYCDAVYARSATVTHELGHSVGLRHSPDSRELMYGAFSGAVDFGPREVQIMALVLQRRGGNLFPDNDRSAAGNATSRTLTIRCR